MAPKPILDLDAIDLETVIADPNDIRKVLAQRGRLYMLDGILHEDKEGQVLVGYKDIRSDDWWCDDHFPGRPVFPGALLIESAAQLASYDYIRNRATRKDGNVGFGGVDSTRFRNAVLPDSRVIFVAKLTRARGTMFRYDTQGFVDGKIVFESHIMGVVF
ncbi:MAG: 3-hydroxyacyl-[acyl-carrier-protein] dehydratase [Planctomycetota bacterium]|jgi:3-hydroxyacyl-[acyl-carrier-protein] dehydratase